MNEDVKKEMVDTDQTASSVVEDETKSTEGDLEAQASADSLNTDSAGNAIPYDRFKQKVDEVNLLKQQLEELSQYKNTYDTIASEEVLRDNFNEMIAKYQEGKLTKPGSKSQEELSEIDKIRNEIQQTVKKLEDSKRETEQVVVNQYVNRLKQLASDSGFSEEQLPLIAKAADLYMEKINGWNKAYNPSLIDDVFKKVKNNFDKYADSRINSMASKKEAAPPVNSGSPPVDNKQLSKEDFINGLADVFKRRNE